MAQPPPDGALRPATPSSSQCEAALHGVLRPALKVQRLGRHGRNPTALGLAGIGGPGTIRALRLKQPLTRPGTRPPAGAGLGLEEISAASAHAVGSTALGEAGW